MATVKNQATESELILEAMMLLFKAGYETITTQTTLRVNDPIWTHTGGSYKAHDNWINIKPCAVVRFIQVRS